MERSFERPHLDYEYERSVCATQLQQRSVCKLDKNVPFLSSIRMSPFNLKTVGAVGMWETQLLRFPRAVGSGGKLAGRH